MMKRALKPVLLAGLLVQSATAQMNLQHFIQEQLAGGERHIVIPPGRYPTAPVEAAPDVETGTHLYLRNLKDVTIDAEGVEMVCTETTRALWIKDCTNLTIRGLTIDYDPLPFTQGRITELSADGHVHTVRLFAGYPPAESAIGFKYEIFQPDGRTLRFGEYHDVSVKVVDSRTLQVIKNESQYWKQGGEQVGDLIVIGSESGPRSEPHAVVLENSKHTRLETIRLYASNCFGFLETHCDGSVYKSCVIDRRSPESDPVEREFPRLRSLNADAYHSKFAVHGPQLIECSAFFQGDDAVNINGSYHLIAESRKNRLMVFAKREMDIQPGDTVELVESSGRPLPDAKVLSVEPAGRVGDDDRQLVETLPILQQIRDTLRRKYEIELDRRISIEPGGVICSRQRVGNGLKVIDCRFGWNRSRGILIKADGEVRGNTIDHCGMQAILVAPEYNWLEAGYVRNLDIRNNVILNSGKAAIEIHGIGKYPGHENITVAGNRIETEHRPAVAVSGAENVRLEDNTLNGRPLEKRRPEVITDN